MLASLNCNFKITSDCVRELIARKNELEAYRKTVPFGDESCDLRQEIIELTCKIHYEHAKWQAANKHLFQHKIELGKKLSELHFFRFGKIDRWEQAKNKINTWDYSLEDGHLARMLECYNELPTDVRLDAVDLIAWGEQHLNNREIQRPSLEDLQKWMNGTETPTQLLCSRLVGEYIKHFGTRFVVNGATARAQMK